MAQQPFAIPQPPIELPNNIYLPRAVADSSPEPPEGRRNIPFSIAWTVDVPTGRSARFNAESGATAGANNQFSAIRTIYIDNTNCGAVVAVVFPDTGFEIQAPAYSSGYYPVVSRARVFFVFSGGARAGDVSFFNVLNYDVSPLVTYTFEQAQIGIVSGLAIPAGAAGTAVSNPVAAGTVGVLRTARVSLVGFGNGAALGSVVVSLTDNSGAITYASDAVTTAAGVTISNQCLIDLQSVDIRFTNGLSVRTLNNTANSGGAIVTANLYYNQG